MANYFIGSVGTAEAFKIKDDKLEVAFISKTLTDSAINISTTKEDLRAGTGAAIVTSFYHDPTVEITLTDVMWKRAYVEAQLGADFTNSTTNYFTEEITAAADGILTLTNQPVGLPIACDIGSDIVWITKSGKSDWKAYDFTNGSFTITNAVDFIVGSKYCVRYLAADNSAKEVIITSNIVPKELYLIITAPLFAGDKCSASTATYAGTITFEVPRFRLNGAQEFSLNMSANTTMSLAGTAYSSEGGCDLVTGGKLVRIIETIFVNQNVAPDRIYIEDSTRTQAEMDAGGILNVYGIYGDVVKLLNNTNNVAFTKTSVGGTIVNGLIGGAWLTAETINAAYKPTGGSASTITDNLYVIA